MSQSLKVSIIVPVYNTADFLEECLESIRLQTYKNFEVLIINDGSTDNSREICECFCKTDFRFKLFNQVQSGLSVSRNNGLLKAEGELVLFVDSDDRIKSNLLEYCLDVIEETNVEVVVFSYYLTNKGLKKNTNFLDPNFGVVDSKKALKELIQGSFGSYSWKILTYKKNYTAFNILFPKGRHYEDIATTYKILGLANKVYLSSKKLYYYEQRNNSITHIYSDKDFIDMKKTFSEMHEFLKNRFPDIEVQLIKLEFNMICMLLIRTGNWDKRLTIHYSTMQKQHIKYLDSIIIKDDITLKDCCYLKIKSILLKIKIFPFLVFLKNRKVLTEGNTKA